MMLNESENKVDSDASSPHEDGEEVPTALRIILRVCHLQSPILGPKDLCTLLAVSTACNTAVQALPRNCCWPCTEVSPACFELREPGPEQLNSFSKWLPAHANLVTGLVIEDSRFAAATEDRNAWEAGLVSALLQLPGLQSLTMRSPDSRYASVSENDGDYSGTCHAPAFSNASNPDSDLDSEFDSNSDSLSAGSVLACISSMSQLTYLEAGALPLHGPRNDRRPIDTTLPSSLVKAKLYYKMCWQEHEQTSAKDLNYHKYAHLCVVDLRNLQKAEVLDITMLKGHDDGWGDYSSFQDGGGILMQNPAAHLTQLSLRGRVIEVDKFAFPQLREFTCTLDPPRPVRGGRGCGGLEAFFVEELGSMIRAMPQLECLRVHGLYKSFQGLEQEHINWVLKAIAPAKALTYLHLPNLQLAEGKVAPGTVGRLLQQLRCLRQVDIGIVPLTQQDIMPLAGLCELTCLTVRGLSYSDQDVRALEECCSSITQLQQCTVVQL